jgi:hypothetical protein
MKTPLAFALLALLAFAAVPANAAERACRPSLSNLYHCPDRSAPAASKPTPAADTSGRACRPSVSNLWTCPGTVKRSIGSRACRPSLSNGYSCPGTSSQSGGSAPSKTASLPKRACRPSLSNGYNCAGKAGADQYATEAGAWVNCPTDTVVWANLNSDIYHFHGTSRYGNTKHGAYMCEQDSRHAGMRAAKNEKHP